MVIEMNLAINHILGLLEGGRRMTVDVLRFQNAKEIFGQSIVVRVPTPSANMGKAAVVSNLC